MNPLGDDAVVTIAGVQGPRGEAVFWAAKSFKDNAKGRWVRCVPLFPDGGVAHFLTSSLPELRWALVKDLTVHMGAEVAWPTGAVA